jgi:hypothetical protein
VDEPTKYKAQVYDLALNFFFKARKLDAASLTRNQVEVGWDIAEAVVAAAVSGVTWNTENKARWFDAAQMLRHFADMVEEDGLASLEWGYKGKLDARHAWRPDIRTDEGRAELHERVRAVIGATYRPLRALTVPERQAIICTSYIESAVEELVLIAMEALDPAEVRQLAVGTAEALLEKCQALPGPSGTAASNAT